MYDTEGIPPGMIVTGSARLDTYRKMGDSLAGRFFHYRLHPLDLKEIKKWKVCSNEDALQLLCRFSGFPEPFLKASASFYGKWKKTHLDIILKQDIYHLKLVKSLSSIETLVQMLRQRVASPVSYLSLAHDLHTAPKVVKDWLELLEDLYVIFKIPPWHKNIARSILKSPKYYFYDTAQVMDEGAKFENLVACALLKELHFRTDAKGQDWGLFYLRDKDKREVDFFITKDHRPYSMVEAKMTEDRLSRGLTYFGKHFPSIPKTQLVCKLTREKTYPGGYELRQAPRWLSRLDF